MAGINARRKHSYEVMEGMDKASRELVQEFGLPIVTAMHKHGVKSPRAITEIVREVWAGARQFNQRNDASGLIDWLLIQSGSSLSAKGLARVLAENNMFIVGAEPSRAMLEASMAEVSGFNVRVTREEKHRRRLRAAIRAAGISAIERR